MLSSSYRVIFMVAVISVSWSEAALTERFRILDELLELNALSVEGSEESPVDGIQCPINEVPNEFNSLELYCDSDELDLNYYETDKPAACRCAVGFRRFYDGTCRSDEDCIAQLNCPPDEIPNLEHIWQPTCNDDDDNTIWMPPQKCLCPTGLLRQSDGTCTPRINCGDSTHFY